MEFSSIISNIRNIEELFSLINDKIKPLFGFNEFFSFFIYVKTNNMFNVRSNPSIKNPNNYLKSEIKVEGIFSDFSKWDDAFILEDSWKYSDKTNNLDEMLSEMWDTFGFRYSISYLLNNFDEVLGIFNVNYNEPVNLSIREKILFKAISEQLGSALSNILAIENLEQKEKEKELLLSISEKLVNIRNFEELFEFLKINLVKYFGLNKIINICLFDDDLVYYKKTFSSIKLNISNESNNVLIESNEIYKFLLLSSKPIVFGIEDFKYKLSNNLVELEEILSYDTKYYIGNTLKVGNKKLGIIEILIKDEYVDIKLFKLFQSISEQIAVSIAHILANDAMIQINNLLINQNSYLLEEVDQNYNFEELIGESQSARKIYQQINQVAKNDTSVLILGETGTGKELVARAIPAIFIKIPPAQINHS
ncbi:MAG: sigma 54-interacting transcriptional regulator [Candidatus Kapabacteria bacterium]|nr:sigma 54-interacting transcriptional regulator [Candidatus Kapabacteria bacterium]